GEAQSAGAGASFLLRPFASFLTSVPPNSAQYRSERSVAPSWNAIGPGCGGANPTSPLHTALTIFGLTRITLHGSARVPSPLYLYPFEPAGLPSPIHLGPVWVLCHHKPNPFHHEFHGLASGL